MDDNTKEIDLREALDVLKKHWFVCCAVALIAGIAAFLLTFYVMEKEYTSSVSLYVNNNASSTNVNLNDINASQKLADTYIVILENGGAFGELSKRLDGEYSANELSDMITLSVVDSTEVVKITAVANNPEEAARICGQFVEIAPDELEKVVLGGVVRVIGEPSINRDPSAPNVMKTTIAVTIAAGIITSAIYILLAVLDVRIRSEKDITDRYDAAVLGTVPEQIAAYEQITGNKNGVLKKSKRRSTTIHNPIISDTTPFSLIEAYNKICVNIRFSVSQEKRRVIGITSAIPGEFKSTTASNLAISIALSGAHVLLVDADMRKPTLHNCMRVPNECGLSNILAGFCDVGDALYENLKPNLGFLPSGLIPPNPVTLLGSDRAKKLFSTLGAEYDYVIIDLPPINLVSDAALLSQYATGMLMIMRAGKCSTTSVDAAMRSLDIAKANVLGIIMTGAEISQSPYGSYGYGYSYSYGERSHVSMFAQTAEDDE